MPSHSQRMPEAVAIRAAASSVFAVRVLSHSDFDATIRWAHTAQQVVDAVGLYCCEPEDGTTTEYRRRGGVPTELELERVLYKACLELRSLATSGTP